LRLPGANWPARAVRVAALAHLGRSDDATDALAELMRFRTDITLSFVRYRMPTTDATYLKNFVEGLRKAGLSE